MNNPILIIMVGLPGSGKSTYAKDLVKKKTYGEMKIFSSDQYRKDLFGDETNQDHNGCVFMTMHKDLVDHLKQGKNAIYDATNVKPKDRKTIIKLVKDIDVDIVYFWVRTPLEVCLENCIHREFDKGNIHTWDDYKGYYNLWEKVIDKMSNNFKSPLDTEEHKEHIVIIVEDQKWQKSQK